MKTTTLTLNRDDAPHQQHNLLNWLISSTYLLEILLAIGMMFIFPIAPTHSYQPTLKTVDRSSAPKPIQIQHRSLIVSKNLQQEIIRQIPALDRQIHEQFKVFSIPINQKINLVYFHQGRDCWKLKFTYGGYLIDTTDETIYTTQEIFKLKRAFLAIDKIDLAGRTYDTSGSMQQMGPILHTRSTGC
jgi:hypothetical protein